MPRSHASGSLLLIVVLACSPAIPPAASDKPVVRMALRHWPGHTDPIAVTEEAEAIVAGFTHRRLYRLTDSGVKPDLVLSERIEPELLAVRIRPVALSDSQIASAELAYQSLIRLRKSGLSPFVLSEVRDIRVVRDELILRIRRNNHDLVRAKLAIPQAAIYQPGHPSAGYRWMSEHRYESEQFAVEFVRIPAALSRWFAFRRGHIDFTPVSGPYRFLPHHEAARLVMTGTVVWYAAIVPGQDSSDPLSDAAFRRYLNGMYPRQEICSRVLEDACIPGDYPVPDRFATNPGAFSWPTSYRGRLLYDEETIIYVPEDSERRLIASVLADTLRKAGMTRVRIVTSDMPSILRWNAERKRGFYLLRWLADYPHAENFLVPLFHSGNAGSGGNRSWFRDEQLDRMLDHSSWNPAELTRIQNRIREQSPWLFLGFGVSEFAVSSRACVRDWMGFHPETFTANKNGCMPGS